MIIHTQKRHTNCFYNDIIDKALCFAAMLLATEASTKLDTLLQGLQPWKKGLEY